MGHWIVPKENQLFYITKYRAENETVGIPNGFPEWRALELTARSKSMRSACMSWVSGTPSSLGVPSSLRARTTWPHTYLWATNREQTFQPSVIDHLISLEFLILRKVETQQLPLPISIPTHIMERNPNCIHSGPLNCEHVHGERLQLKIHSCQKTPSNVTPVLNCEFKNQFGLNRRLLA